MSIRTRTSGIMVNINVEPATTPSTLKNGLVSFWEMEEASSTNRIDAVGNSNMIDQSPNVPQVTGKVNFGAGFTATNMTLLAADVAAYDFSGGASVAFWFFFVTSVPAIFTQMIRKAIPTNEWKVTFLGNSSQVFEWQAFDAGANPYTVDATTFGIPSANTWYYIVCTADNSNMKISVNAGTQDSAVQSAAIRNSASGIQCGDSDSAPNYRFDQVGIWNRALTPAEITQLYNGGTGLTYAQM